MFSKAAATSASITKSYVFPASQLRSYMQIPLRPDASSATPVKHFSPRVLYVLPYSQIAENSRAAGYDESHIRFNRVVLTFSEGTNPSTKPHMFYTIARRLGIPESQWEDYDALHANLSALGISERGVDAAKLIQHLSTRAGCPPLVIDADRRVCQNNLTGGVPRDGHESDVIRASNKNPRGFDLVIGTLCEPTIVIEPITEEDMIASLFILKSSILESSASNIVDSSFIARGLCCYSRLLFRQDSLFRMRPFVERFLRIAPSFKLDPGMSRDTAIDSIGMLKDAFVTVKGEDPDVLTLARYTALHTMLMDPSLNDPGKRTLLAEYIASTLLYRQCAKGDVRLEFFKQVATALND